MTGEESKQLKYLKIVNDFDKKFPTVQIMDLKEITSKFLKVLEYLICENQVDFESLILIYPSYFQPYNNSLTNINQSRVVFYSDSDAKYQKLIKEHIYTYIHHNIRSISKHFVENPNDEIKIDSKHISLEDKRYEITQKNNDSEGKEIFNYEEDNSTEGKITTIDLTQVYLETTGKKIKAIEIIEENNNTIKTLKESIELHYPLVEDSDNIIYYLFSNTGTIDKKHTGYGGLFLIFKREPIVELLDFFRIICNKLSVLVAINIYQYLLRLAQTRSAINSILIDSYAHNISAHSLNFLQSLFNYRTEQYLKKHYSIPQFGRLENLPLNIVSYSDLFSANQKNKEVSGDALKHYKALGISDNSNTVFDANLLDYILYSSQFENKEGDDKIEASDLLRYNDGERHDDEHRNGKLPMPLDYAIAPLLTYLRDKGAFWSGVIRNNEASPSRIVSMYDLLMEMFNNPLFIGSIMAAEEFFVVHVFVDVEDKVATDNNNAERRNNNDNRTVEENTNDRHLLTINIKEFVKAEMTNTEEKNSDEGYKKYRYLNGDNYSNMNFVRLGMNHAALREALQEQTILLPGGDVGKHAFFTIVENTLRNAKHIVQEHRNDIKQNGLELHFQIREYNFKLREKILEQIIKDKSITDPLAKNAEKERVKSPKAIETNLDTHETELKQLISNGVVCDLEQFLKDKIEIIEENAYKKIANSLINDKELYFIGINLNYRKRDKKDQLTYTFDSPETDDAQTKQFKMMESVIWSSYQPILTDEGHPRMGGSSQDKVCAAALFNKTFTSTEYPHKDAKGYYPWIAYNLYPDSPASIKKNLIYNDELRLIDSLEERRKLIEKKIEDGPDNFHLDRNLHELEDATFSKNLYIKLFHVWKARNVQVFKEEIKYDDYNGKFIDTIPRYKIAVVRHHQSKEALQKRAVIRILEKNVDTISDEATDNCFETLYQEWNKKWLYGCGKYDAIKFCKNDHSILIDNKSVICVDEAVHLNHTNELTIKIDHDSGAEQSDVCKIRNHGAFLKTICNNSNHKDFIDGKATIGPAEQQELLETVLTKIFIADNRLFSLVDNYTFGDNKEKKKDKVLKKTLHLNIVNEDEETIEGLQEKIELEELKQQHFLIFHLSYADKLSEKHKGDNHRYEKFIDEIFDLNQNPLPANTIIAMTTGRGREDWLNKTGRHRSHCIHVPIESLQTAIQQGVLFKDDFDIKYNLCKVLFGS